MQNILSLAIQAVINAIEPSLVVGPTFQRLSFVKLNMASTDLDIGHSNSSYFLDQPGIRDYGFRRRGSNRFAAVFAAPVRLAVRHMSDLEVRFVDWPSFANFPCGYSFGLTARLWATGLAVQLTHGHSLVILHLPFCDVWHSCHLKLDYGDRPTQSAESGLLGHLMAARSYPMGGLLYPYGLSRRRVAHGAFAA